MIFKDKWGEVIEWSKDNKTRTLITGDNGKTINSIWFYGKEEKDINNFYIGVGVEPIPYKSTFMSPITEFYHALDKKECTLVDFEIYVKNESEVEKEIKTLKIALRTLYSYKHVEELFKNGGYKKYKLIKNTSLLEYATNQLNELYDIEEDLKPYVDYEQYKNELWDNGCRNIMIDKILYVLVKEGE